MKYIQFPEAIYKTGTTPICLAHSAVDKGKIPRKVVKIRFSKDEARFIANHKCVYLVQNINDTLPEFGFKDPFDKSMEVITQEEYIIKNFSYRHKKFTTMISRKWDNAKVKARFFSVTMDGTYVKYGAITEKDMRFSKGWLKQTADALIKELKELLNSKNNKNE